MSSQRSPTAAQLAFLAGAARSEFTRTRRGTEEHIWATQLSELGLLESRGVIEPESIWSPTERGLTAVAEAF